MADDKNGKHPDNALATVETTTDESPRVPAVDDVVMSSLGQGWETIRELLEFPTLMSNAIPRAVLSQRTTVDLLRSSMQHSLWHDNAWDPMRLAWERMGYSISVDGRGRREAVDIATSAAHRVAAQQQREPRDGPRPR